MILDLNDKLVSIISSKGEARSGLQEFGSKLNISKCYLLFKLEVNKVFGGKWCERDRLGACIILLWSAAETTL